MTSSSSLDRTPAIIENPSSVDLGYVIDSQLQQSRLLSAPSAGADAPGKLKDGAFHSEEDIWSAILAQKLRASQVIQLDNFLIMEWIPRSPGLYFTPLAKD